MHREPGGGTFARPKRTLFFTRLVPKGTVAEGSLSFLGGIANAGERIGRVRITTGNAALGPGVNETANVDLAVMDDFLYSEPQQVPEPMTLGLLALGFAAAARRLHR